ncbi:hypothetical protein QBC43DRAFT_308727 [Cladorrhinum sp. PSN259]|nr:hypothetical protein QBC43DRAFT_308727 [Cladorrhinum sp. PSN259]
MAPALALRRALGRNALANRLPGINKNSPSICLFCSLSTFRRPLRPSLPSKPDLGEAALAATLTGSRRFQSTDLPDDPYSYNQLSQVQLRAELAARLQELQSQFPDLVQPDRLKLALRNLSEMPGQESIRIAILNPYTQSAPSDPSENAEYRSAGDTTVKQLVRATLADELSVQSEWERQLEEHDLEHNPLILRVQPNTGEQGKLAEGKKEGSIPEIVATSPTLGRLGLELLLSRVSLPKHQGLDVRSLQDSLLVPKVHQHGSQEIDFDSVRETSDVATPVHYTLLVRKGLTGALEAIRLLENAGDNYVVEQAVDLKTTMTEGELEGKHPAFIRLNVDAANKGLEAMRTGDVDLFMDKWLEGNASKIRDWLKQKSAHHDDGNRPERAKPAVTNLVESLLERARSQVGQNKRLIQSVAGADIGRLQKSLEGWAEKAHEELQQQLNVAVTKRSWRKLSWWKLFWRADDVGRITSDMVAEHFLPQAEKSIIHLTGRIYEAVTKAGKDLQQPGYESPENTSAQWPIQIPYTRNLIQEHTVPSLQSLAQKLVIRSAGISGLSAGLAGLSYFYAAGAYECGAIAALGVILSFRQIQSRWEKAQRYWEIEVREEGRKAIRATENSINGMLNWASEGQLVETQRKQEEEAERAMEIIQRAQEALKRL